MTASDDDVGYAGLVQYTLDPAYNTYQLFNIDLYSGCIRVARNLTQRPTSVNEVSVHVHANDMANNEQRSTSVLVNVRIEDVNNHAPVFDRAVYRIRISEVISPFVVMQYIHNSFVCFVVGCSISNRSAASACV